MLSPRQAALFLHTPPTTFNANNLMILLITGEFPLFCKSFGFFVDLKIFFDNSDGNYKNV